MEGQRTYTSQRQPETNCCWSCLLSSIVPCLKIQVFANCPSPALPTAPALRAWKQRTAVIAPLMSSKDILIKSVAAAINEYQCNCNLQRYSCGCICVCAPKSLSPTSVFSKCHHAVMNRAGTSLSELHCQTATETYSNRRNLAIL